MSENPPPKALHGQSRISPEDDVMPTNFMDLLRQHLCGSLDKTKALEVILLVHGRQEVLVFGQDPSHVKAHTATFIVK